MLKTFINTANIDGINYQKHVIDRHFPGYLSVDQIFLVIKPNKQNKTGSPYDSALIFPFLFSHQFPFPASAQTQRKVRCGNAVEVSSLLHSKDRHFHLPRSAKQGNSIPPKVSSSNSVIFSFSAND